MLIKFFPNGKGAGAGPVGYLVAERVLAYDGNRDLIRDADGQPLTVTRDPLPEVLRGDPSRTEALIDASRHQWTYRAGVIGFAAEDAPSEAQQAEVMDAFEQLAFAGLDGEQYDMLWVRHSHEDRVELHFCTPRLELTTGRSLNIAPPGYQDAYDSLRDLMNQRHGWADPMELERAQEVRDTTEAPTRAQGRDELHAWILDQVSVGLITDRASMLDAVADGQALIGPETSDLSIWRVEFRAGKNLLKDRWDIRTWEDLFARFGDLSNETGQVIRYTLPTAHDTNRARWLNHPIWETALGEINTDLIEMYEGNDPNPVKEIQRSHHISVLLKNIKGSTITLAALEGVEEQDLERFFKDTASKLSDQAKADPDHTAKQLKDARDRYAFINPANRNTPPSDTED